jgi:hydroxyacylglutathione hydrolase
VDERDLAGQGQDGPRIRLVRAGNPSALTGTGTNTWILGEGRVAVIDPGPALPAHLEAILSSLQRGERVEAILVTHPHLDHSALARPLAARTGAPVMAFGAADAGRSAVMARLLADGLSGGGEGADPGFAPDIALRDGEVLGGADWRLTCLHTPGHMGAHLCFDAGGVLFSGDLVMGWSTSIVSPPDGDMGAYMASLARLAEGGWRRFLPGHGDAVAAPAARLAELLAHRRAREAQILGALQTGPADAARIARTVYAGLEPRLMPAAERNTLAHLIDLWERSRITTPAPLRHDSLFRLM